MTIQSLTDAAKWLWNMQPRIQALQRSSTQLIHVQGMAAPEPCNIYQKGNWGLGPAAGEGEIGKMMHSASNRYGEASKRMEQCSAEQLEAVTKQRQSCASCVPTPSWTNT